MRIMTKSESKDFDPWVIPEPQDTGSKWQEMSCGKNCQRVLTNFVKICVLLGLLYMFICSLDFLGSAFQLLGGKAAGEAFASNKILSNPVAGLMIGLLSTVFVQSSSTSTSIIVTMVAAEIIDVCPAIPIIMGANIGTSVTNTLVSLAQAGERDEFRRAFAGATVHDIFNWLSVIILLPIEVATNYLYHLTNFLLRAINLEESKQAKKELRQAITKPLTSLVIQLDKKVIPKIATGNEQYEAKSLIETSCSKKTIEVLANITLGVNTSDGLVNRTVQRLQTQVVGEPCNFLFFDSGLSDTTVAIILLIGALVILCLSLVFIVRILHSLLKGQLATVIKKTVNADFPGPLRHVTGYFAIMVGAGMTVLLQSSSIFTSALTPLIGIGVVSLERAFPLTLGANIGTTATGIFAAMASDNLKLRRALQIALCHLFFNLSGILIWYPVPYMRNVPIRFAKTLGNMTATYRWLALAYLIFGFFLLPTAVFGLSIAGWRILLGVAAPIVLLLLFVVIVNLLQGKDPSSLPKRLRNWEWVPRWARSLEPYDKMLARAYKLGQGECSKSRMSSRRQILPDAIETHV